ncbi:antitermination protein, partial [Salmonella enterica]|nr:antitermination protein [Salmonella enterica]EFR2617029.1 antitermination protein [Salmonella enterica]
RLETKERGAPVYKVCERCSGKGFTDVPSTAAYKVILRYVPDLHVRTWTRNWRPFYEHLVDICWRAEKMADSEFQQVTAEE